MRVYLPEGMSGYKEDLEFFVSLMVRKLHTNRHKGVEVDMNPCAMVLGAVSEIDEVWRAITDEGQFETAVECADVANFMFLAAMSSLHLTRADFKRLGEDRADPAQISIRRDTFVPNIAGAK